jgi:hypothetical protein
MRTGRPIAEIELSGDVAGILGGYTQRRKTAQALALRARIVLGCAAGLSNKSGGGTRAGERANGWQVAPALCRAWPRRAAAGRPAQDRRCQGRKRYRLTLESQPSAATHWSTRSMACHSGISTSSVGRIWRSFGLQPDRIETVKLSADPLFVDKARDIVGL